MLSGESAIGDYPEEAIAMMSSIAMHAETSWMSDKLAGPPEIGAPTGIDATMAYASHVVAQSLSAQAIVIHTSSGSTGRRIASYRPRVPVLALAASLEAQRRLALTWGVETTPVDQVKSTEHLMQLAARHAISCNLAAPGDTIVIAAGTPFGNVGRTNMVQVEEIPEDLNLQAR
jgi:pyruvate kinase